MGSPPALGLEERHQEELSCKVATMPRRHRARGKQDNKHQKILRAFSTIRKLKQISLPRRNFMKAIKAVTKAPQRKPIPMTEPSAPTSRRMSPSAACLWCRPSPRRVPPCDRVRVACRHVTVAVLRAVMRPRPCRVPSCDHVRVACSPALC